MTTGRKKVTIIAINDKDGNKKMNETDLQILKLLQEDSRLSAQSVAQSVGITEAEAKRRIRAMEEQGIIVAYTAIVNAEEIEEKLVEALIEVKVTPLRGHGFDKIAREIASHEEVRSVYLMSGGYDLTVIVRGTSLREVARFVSEKISQYDTVISTATHFILKKYKVEGAEMAKGTEVSRLSVQA